MSLLVTPRGQDWAIEVRREELRRKRAERKAQAGMNLANSLADLDVVFPWEAELRAFSPITEIVSHLRAYWYRAGLRWVLYECIPLALLPRDDTPVRVDLSGQELFAAIAGRPPRMRSDDEEPCPISDLQHEMARRWNVWAGPLIVLQGTKGGHFVKLDPFLEALEVECGRDPEQPVIGSLPACPFDERTKEFLGRHNRLRALGNSMDKLKQSGSREYALAQQAAMQKEARLAGMQLIERQFEGLVEMTSDLAKKSDSFAGELVHVPGMAAKAVDAYQEYADTGIFTLKF